MKKLLMLTCLLLAGCDERTAMFTTQAPEVWTDPKTKCEWLVFYGYSGGVDAERRDPKCGR